MSNFVEQLRLAEKAAEDIYCARVDRELIAALHERMRAEKNSLRPLDPSCIEARAEVRQAVTRGTI